MSHVQYAHENVPESELALRFAQGNALGLVPSKGRSPCRGENMFIVKQSNSFTRRKRMPVHLPRNICLFCLLRALGAEGAQNSFRDRRNFRNRRLRPRAVGFIPTGSRSPCLAIRRRWASSKPSSTRAIAHRQIERRVQLTADPAGIKPGGSLRRAMALSLDRLVAVK